MKVKRIYLRLLLNDRQYREFMSAYEATARQFWCLKCSIPYYVCPCFRSLKQITSNNYPTIELED